jgi:hypothetical protein
MLLNILKDIEDLINTKFINNDVNEQKFNNIKSLIYSMKEMRDWYYVKEIINKNFEFTKIYCTSDSINLFRSVLYGISTINLHNNHIKYFALNYTNNNKKYVFCKQISPSYFYTFDAVKEDLIKQKMFNLINNENTFIIKKEIIGGNNNLLTINNINKKNDYLILSNIKTKKYLIKYNMDIIKFDLASILIILKSRFNNLMRQQYNENILLNCNNVDNINNENLISIKHLYEIIPKIYEFTNKYNYENLKNINYKCHVITNEENIYIKEKLNGDIYSYKNELELFERNCINHCDEIFNKYKNSKFYSNPNYILSDNEILSSMIIHFVIEKLFDVDEREKFGYLIKIILNEYDYNLFRNALALFYDVDDCYNEYIRGKFKFVETFDEDDYEYKTKIATDYFYSHENDKLPTEYFEDDYKLYSSKYNELQQIIKDKNI